MSSQLTAAQTMKFALFFGGIKVTANAESLVMRPYGNRPLTLADYASTSGISLMLDGDVWVNAPISAHNPNMVFDPRHELRAEDERLYVRDLDSGVEIAARFVPVPAYHDQRNEDGELFTDYVHTHTDRARIAPIRGCAMRCHFCDIPYEFKGRYFRKPIARLLDAATQAINDPVQPAMHLLISGGTPGRRDYAYLREVYRSVITAFKEFGTDIMMAPIPELIDLEELSECGVNELSLNIEIWDLERARQIMPEKYRMGRSSYLDFIAASVDRLGRGRVRSILMVGLEEPESTLAGVEALAKVGCVPVLSPFRPDPITDLANLPPPSVDDMISIFLEATEITSRYGIKLGPRCIPCSHNTMTLTDGSDDYGYNGHRPNLI
jgi:hypothetical protein